ncbi:cobyric acid synthase [Lichenibacterium ramalinae]|uniref:Cobyric acid synthase n=1 Tax=Lichenibacterium ramalinae TaxID=2316527 RepID=A0A4Q2RCR9_9HYPH|nr:cobyric acid synthase [Lichenibacterium ramalinae]RYB04407.1 cobyric acid synthase [Lichenibacterium ramalinae]
MLQGTGSNVGKSLIVAGLARAYARRGLRVRPFKPQNMSNNAAVTADGGEIGRAQALQARAAGVEPTVHMNPVLLKPQSEIGSQVVVQGRVIGNAKAREYQSWKPRLMEAVLDSFGRLAGEADLIHVEGAGSPAEVNLRANDIAIMGFARRADVPVVLIGDIDRGGVVAQIVGTSVVIDPEDAALVAGFLVNKFYGDPTLFEDGMAFISERTGWPALGLVLHFAAAARLPAEDAVALDRAIQSRLCARARIAVPVLPRISNFDDLDPLKLEADVDLLMVRAGTALPVCDLVVLPGSKATVADLGALRSAGWDIDILAHVRRGGRVLGLCGGYQMLGRSVGDPLGLEGPPGTVAGLGLLDVDTVLGDDKVLRPVVGRTVADGEPFSDYEMHMGKTRGPDRARPVLRFSDGTCDGAASADGRVAGCYVHGLFADDRQRAAWLHRLGAEPTDFAYEAEVERVLDGLAAHLEEHVDLDRMLALAR